MDLSDLYSDKILEIAGNQPVPGRLADADASARKVSRVCGSTIEVDIKVSDGVIVGYGHDISACALGQTSAAHELCSGLRPYMKRHHLQTGVGHYGLFSGKRWETQIYPIVRNTILTMAA